VIDVPAFVVRATNGVEKREKIWEVLCYGSSAGFAGAGIEHVDNVE
jgi:hypothetical protein